MASITLTFAVPIQDSVQKGDIIYYCKTSTVGTFNTANNIIKMGDCTAINPPYSLTCNIPDDLTRPSSGDYIMFSKDNRGNASTMTGYYAEVKLSNNSETHAEIFHISSEVFESSK
tara:strand:- start:67 stop:414 length:348 start_codon:yes stop_codon:yes gene_type:complete